MHKEDTMALLDRTQVCGMNIHYMKYSLDYFLDAQQRAGFKSIELWGGIPHIFMDAVSYEDTKQIASKIHSRGLEVKVFTPEKCINISLQQASLWHFKKAWIILKMEFALPLS